MDGAGDKWDSDPEIGAVREGDGFTLRPTVVAGVSNRRARERVRDSLMNRYGKGKGVGNRARAH